MRTIIKERGIAYALFRNQRLRITFDTIDIRSFFEDHFFELMKDGVPTGLPDGYFFKKTPAVAGGVVAKLCKKGIVKSTMPEFKRLERALIKANNEIGWKNLTAFIEQWFNQNQPSNTGYSLKFWMKEHRR